MPFYDAIMDDENTEPHYRTLMKHIAFATILLCCVATTEMSCAQTWNQMYNLDMSSQRNWRFLPFECKLEYDSTRSVGGRVWAHIDYDNSFQMGGRVLLPKISYDSECEVSVTLRTDTLCDPVAFKINVIDRNENLIASQQMSIIPQSNIWQEYSVKLPHIDGINELYILLEYPPKADPRKSRLWIDRFTIRIDGEDIGEWDMADKLTTAPAVLNPEHTVSLALDNTEKDIVSQICNMKKQRFVALGECTHGSASIRDVRLRFCKDMILNHKTKYLVFELNAIPILALNFYIHGYDLPNIEQYMRYIEENPFLGAPFIDFLEWIRQYNHTHRRKISIFGMDTHYKYIQLPQFFRDLLPSDEANICCRLFEENHYIELMNTVKQNNRLHDAIGDELFDTLIATLECTDFMLRMNDTPSQRDINMFRFIVHLDKRMFQKNEKVVILAHSLHTCCMIPYNYIKSLGCMMREKYSYDYFSLSFQVGEGEYLQDAPVGVSSLKNSWSMFADTLRTPIEGSFELAAMRTGWEYLYYPSKYLDDNTSYLSYIGRRGDRGTHYKLCNLKSCHDGYIFIRNSRPCEYHTPD